MNEAAPTQQFPQLRMEIRGLAEREVQRQWIGATITVRFTDIFVRRQ